METVNGKHMSKIHEQNIPWQSALDCLTWHHKNDDENIDGTTYYDRDDT